MTVPPQRIKKIGLLTHQVQRQIKAIRHRTELIADPNLHFRTSQSQPASKTLISYYDSPLLRIGLFVKIVYKLSFYNWKKPLYFKLLSFYFSFKSCIKSL
jgi:hypothetical protein